MIYIPVFKVWNTGNDWSRYSLVQGTLLNKQFQFGIDWNLLYNPSISPCSTFQDGKPLIGTTNVAFYKVEKRKRIALQSLFQNRTELSINSLTMGDIGNYTCSAAKDKFVTIFIFSTSYYSWHIQKS